MINIFRKYRRKLSNKSIDGKYLKYAFGEIALVVMGILIALTINNWNENRKNRISEVEILEALKADFSETKVRVTETIVSQEYVIEQSTSLANSILLKNENQDAFTIYAYISAGALSYWRVEPVTGTYDALIGSGKTSLIQNTKLARALAEFSSEITYGFEDEEFAMNLNSMIAEQTSTYLGVLMQSLYSSDNSKELTRVKKELVNNTSILGLLDSKINVEKNRLELQKDLLQYSENILEMINSDLGYENEKADSTNVSSNAAQVFEEIVLANEIKENYIGKYQLNLSAYIHITLDENILYARLSGQDKLELFAYEENKFFMKDIYVQMEFEKEGDKVKNLVFHQGGQTYEGRKME